MAWAALRRESWRSMPSFRGASKTRTRNLEIPGLRLTAHPGMTVESGDAGEKSLFRRFDRVGSSHMHPHTIQPQAEQPLLLVGAIEHLCQREFTGWRIGEQRRRHDRDTGIDERNHLMLLALAQRAIG